MIKNTLEVVDFGLKVASGIMASLKDDGKITLSDMTNFVPAVVGLPAALADFQEIPAEIKEIKVEDFDEIKAHVQEIFPDVGEKWATVATEALNIGIAAFNLYKAFQSQK